MLCACFAFIVLRAVFCFIVLRLKHFAQRSGMLKLPTLFVPECREHTDCARLSAAKEWTQDASERTRRLFRK
jgi:hypothetical protein